MRIDFGKVEISMTPTLLKSLVALVPASMLLSGSLYCSSDTRVYRPCPGYWVQDACWWWFLRISAR
jgi:hypothetical protein